MSQNKVNITIFLSQILQRRPCSCKISSGYVPPHCSLRQDNGVSLTSHNAERNSEGGCSTRREFLLLVDSVWLEQPLFSLHGGLVHPKCFQLCLSMVILGESRLHLRFLHSDMQWWPLPDGLRHHHAATEFLCGFSTMTSVSRTSC